MVEFLEDLRDAICLDHDDAARMGFPDLVPVAGIGEIEPSVRTEGEIVRTVEFLPSASLTSTSTFPSRVVFWIDGGRWTGATHVADSWGSAWNRLAPSEPSIHALGPPPTNA